jgi:hypothetical protein
MLYQTRFLRWQVVDSSNKSVFKIYGSATVAPPVCATPRQINSSFNRFPSTPAARSRVRNVTA